MDMKFDTTECICGQGGDHSTLCESQRMKKVHRFGNEFWVEGDWHCAAKVELDVSLRDGSISYRVSFGSHGSSSAEKQRPYGIAIILACDYAVLCPELFAFKDKSLDEIRAEWDKELREFYQTTFKEWNPK